MFTIKGVAYPDKIETRLACLAHTGVAAAGGNAVGTDANFACGSFIRYRLTIDTDLKQVLAAGFTSNGCGYMLAAADVIAEYVTGKGLGDLHGLSDAELRSYVDRSLGEIAADRVDCVMACMSALHGAFTDHRSRQVEEFRGEKALICTCFGVTEETIEYLVASRSLTSVDEVTNACDAGGGCGSCRMLIEEIIGSQ